MYVRKILVNCLERLSLPRNSVVMLTTSYMWTNAGGGGSLQVSLVPLLEQRIAKHTLNSVLKISKTCTLFTVFPTESTPFHNVLSLYFTPNHSGFFFVFFVLFFFSSFLSDLRKLTLFPLKCNFSDPKRRQRCALPSLKKSTPSHHSIFFLFKHQYQVD